MLKLNRKKSHNKVCDSLAGVGKSLRWLVEPGTSPDWPGWYSGSSEVGYDQGL